MERNSTVSAVIPTRNRSHLVLRAVRSVLGQTYEDLEAIVVIDGPDVATEEALKKHPAARPEVLVTSAENGTGIEDLRTLIAALAE